MMHNYSLVSLRDLHFWNNPKAQQTHKPRTLSNDNRARVTRIKNFNAKSRYRSI